MPGFNINAFQTDISNHGYLQTNKFIAAFSSPTCMQGETIDGRSAIDTERLIQVRAESVKIPGIALLQADINRYGQGPTQKMPFNARFTENAITFISDRNGQLYKYFYVWLNKIFDTSGTTGQSNQGASYATEYKDNYATDLHVYIYDNAGNQVKEIVMYKAYPESMNDINLSWNDNSQLLKVTVSFTFRDWAMIGVSNARIGTDTQPARTNKVTTFAGRQGGAVTPSLTSLNSRVRQP